jgi:hypothetical protein
VAVGAAEEGEGGSRSPRSVKGNFELERTRQLDAVAFQYVGPKCQVNYTTKPAAIDEVTRPHYHISKSIFAPGQVMWVSNEGWRLEGYIFRLTHLEQHLTS